MKIGAIITGDIIASTKMESDDRDMMLASLQSLPDILSPIEKVRVEIFRGDSFQIGICQAHNSLKIALAVRAYLRTHKMFSSKKVIDARVAIGIGSIEYEADTLSTSDGEAFRISGRLLDRMEKRRLEIMTPWDKVNDALSLNTAFADDIISSWTQSQSRIELASYIISENRNEIASQLGISRQMVDKSMKISKQPLIRAYIKRFEKIISLYTTC